ncbi:MAG: hypothetical protein ACI9U2_003165 [Bradymonadia bacterium]|jgi:hypothetical protein
MTRSLNLALLLGLSAVACDDATDADPMTAADASFGDAALADAAADAAPMADAALAIDAAPADAAPADAAPADAAPSETVTVVIPNQGGAMEGHTPRGFQGQGAGLFVGDNLNANFPDGDGVQVFLSFDISALPAGEVIWAELRATQVQVSGTPFVDLGEVTAEQIVYEAFSSALWNQNPIRGGHSCVFATAPELPHACDAGPLVDNARRADLDWAQVRLRTEVAGDGDGQADLVSWFLTDSNTNEPGIFELEVQIAP